MRRHWTLVDSQAARAGLSFGWPSEAIQDAHSAVLRHLLTSYDNSIVQRERNYKKEAHFVVSAQTLQDKVLSPLVADLFRTTARVIQIIADLDRDYELNYFIKDLDEVRNKSSQYREKAWTS